MTDVQTLPARDLPARMGDRLIVALDLPGIPEARAMAARLAGVVSFFKVGLGLLFAPGAEGLIDDLLADGNRVFLDAKMYDIPDTVRRGAAMAARRGVTFLTIHGDTAIIDAAMAGKGGADLKILAVSVLTSLDDAALRAMGYGFTAEELVLKRARDAVCRGCDGIIASGADKPDDIRRRAGSESLLVVTPGVRQAQGSRDDQVRTATPGEAIRNGADYLVAGRPIIAAPDPAAAAHGFIAEMEAALR